MSFQVREHVTILPAVPGTQNGSARAHTVRSIYDTAGRLIWVKSPRGFITNFQYDAVTGAVIRKIEDVDVSRASGVPTGWTTPSNGGRHLISDFKVDALGRMLRSLGPEHPVQLSPTDTTTTPVRRASFRLFRDVMGEEWSAEGYESVSGGVRSRHVVGPVRRVMRDEAGRVTDEISVARTSDAWAPTVAEMDNRTNWCAWKTYSYDLWGRVAWTRVYHTIPVSGDGTAAANYDQTTFGYDAMDRRNRELQPSGTITRTVHDVRGLVIRTWVGTNDAGATDSDPSGGGASGNNMTLTSTRDYDGGSAGGNGNLTKVTTETDGTAGASRVTVYKHDYRDRLEKTESEDETGLFREENTLDVLGRVTAQFRYRVEPSMTAPQLIGKSETSYDTRSQAFRQRAWGADDTGAATTYALTSEQWRDAAGNVIKSCSPGSEAREKLVYDGLDRTMARYLVLETPAVDPGSSSGGTSSGGTGGFDGPGRDNPGDGGDGAGSGNTGSGAGSSFSVSQDDGGGGGSSSSASDSSDQPDPPDTPPGPGPGPGDSFSWPEPDPDSSSGQTSSDYVDGGGGNPPETGDKTCPECSEESEEGGMSSTPPESGTGAGPSGGTCGENSSKPVNYATGQMDLKFTDLSVRLPGFKWGHTRVYCNQMSGSTGGMHGHLVLVREQPYLVINAGATGNRVAVVTGGNRSIWFNPPVSGSNVCVPSFGGTQASLVRDTVNNEYTFSTRSGLRLVFNSDASAIPSYLRGKLKSIVDRSGAITTPVYSSQGALISLSALVDGRKVLFSYDYFGSGDGVGYAGRLRSVTLEAGPSTGPEERRRVRYDYHTGTTAHGMAGNLRTVFHEEWDGSTWQVVRCEYYRSYKADSAPGFLHALKYAVGPAGCVQLGDPANYDSFTDAQILAVSDYAFEYDTTSHRVTREKTQGGTQVWTFATDTTTLSPAPGETGIYSGSTLNTNLWYRRTVETRPDGSTNTVYTNRIGKVIASTLTEAGTGRQWHRHNVFDSDGRYVRRFYSSAITSITAPAALNQQPLVDLKATEGKVLELTYTASGQVETESWRQGNTGTLTLARKFVYGTRTVDGRSIYPLTQETAFAVATSTGSDTTGALVKRYWYSYQSGGSVGSLGSETIDSIDYPAANQVTTGDTVLEQHYATLDAGGNVTLQRDYQRFHDATAGGTLNGPGSTSPRARRSYVGYWPDALGRTSLTADYGTNSGLSLTRPEVCPAASTVKVRVTRVDYNNRGEAFRSTDPEGVVTELTNDAAGRRKQIVENVKSGVTAADANRTTTFDWLPGNLLQRMTILNSSTGTQVTEWIYGTTKSSTESAIATGHLLQSKKYPGDTSTTCLRWRYNCAGEVTWQTDANGTIRKFERDRQGRLTHDIADTLGTSGGATVVSTIRRLSRTYNRQGRLQRASSFASSDPASTAAALNYTGFTYNSFGQVTAQEQNRAAGGTGTVNYAYANGSANHLRLTRITAPSGIQTDYTYGTTGGTNDRLSRPQSLRNPADSGNAVDYLYAGLAWIVEAAYPEPAVRMTQHNLGTSVTGDGGDQYVAIDRFGQLEEVRWHKTASPADYKEHLYFGYSKNGNRLWRENLLFPSTDDELYTYDGLQQVKSRKRGNLSLDRLSITGTPQRQEDFSYDSLGNWIACSAQASGSTLLDQTRTHNTANQTATITNTTPSGTVLAISHDPAGNMVQLPPDASADWTKGYKLKWDPWNRLAEVRRAADNVVVGTYQYDALFRRIYRSAGGKTCYEYWDTSWRLLEETATTGSTPEQRASYLWGLRHRNDLVRRDYLYYSTGGSTSGGGSTAPTLTRHYVAYDWINPTTIFSTNGTVVERQSFSAFGQCRLQAPDGTDRTTSVLADWKFKFHGQFYDPETNWSNYGYRYYVPMLGRWLGRDPITEQAGVNLYQMTVNSAINYTDLLGLQLWGPVPVPPGHNAMTGAPLNPAPRPPYDPEKDPDLNNENNCYAYACRDMKDRAWWDPSKQTPGKKGGKPVTPGTFVTCDAVVAGVVADGMGKAFKTEAGKKCPENYYQMTVHVSEGGGDFHFVRQEPDGSYSDKSALNPPRKGTKLDPFDNDPSHYGPPCAVMCICNAGIRVE